MNRFAVLVAVGAVAGCLSVGASSAHAQYFGYGYGWAGGTGPYNLYTNGDTPPFYSLYPPVYYSRPYARSYGFSPFAYPPGFTTPQNSVSSPQGVQTSDVYDADAPPAATSLAAVSAPAPAPTPLVIENPFVPHRK
jgi:hypothetical protein